MLPASPRKRLDFRWLVEWEEAVEWIWMVVDVERLRREVEAVRKEQEELQKEVMEEPRGQMMVFVTQPAVVMEVYYQEVAEELG